MSEAIVFLTAMSYDSLVAGFLLSLTGLSAKRMRFLLLFTVFDGAATWINCLGVDGMPLNLKFGLAAFVMSGGLLTICAMRRDARLTRTRAIYLIPLVLCLDNLVAPSNLLAAQSPAIRAVLAGAASGLLFLVGTWTGDLVRQSTRRLLLRGIPDLNF